MNPTVVLDSPRRPELVRPNRVEGVVRDLLARWPYVRQKRLKWRLYGVPVSDQRASVPRMGLFLFGAVIVVPSFEPFGVPV